MIALLFSVSGTHFLISGSWRLSAPEFFTGIVCMMIGTTVGTIIWSIVWFAVISTITYFVFLFLHEKGVIHDLSAKFH